MTALPGENILEVSNVGRDRWEEAASEIDAANLLRHWE